MRTADQRNFFIFTLAQLYCLRRKLAVGLGRRGRNYGVLDRSNISTTIIQLVKDTGELTLSLDRQPAVEPIDFRYSAAFYASCL